jgi:DNA-binding transcriptional LysR family regulator
LWPSQKNCTLAEPLTALSRQIQQLEEELGINLFERTKRQVKLTTAGRLFADEARLILAHAEQATNLARRVSLGQTGQLLVGLVASVDRGLYVDALKLFRQRYRGVRLTLVMMNPIDQLRALHDGRLDVGMLHAPPSDPTLVMETLMHLPLMVALPKAHPLAARRRVPLRALARESHILAPREMSPHFYDLLVGACRTAGFALNPFHEVQHIYTYSALILAAAGFGVAFVPAVRSHDTDVVLRRLHDPELDLELCVAYRRENSSAVLQSFLNVVREITGKYSRELEKKRSSRPKSE